MGAVPVLVLRPILRAGAGPLAARAGAAGLYEVSVGVRDDVAGEIGVVQVDASVHHSHQSAGAGGGGPRLFGLDLVQAPLLGPVGVVRGSRHLIGSQGEQHACEDEGYS